VWGIAGAETKKSLKHTASRALTEPEVCLGEPVTPSLVDQIAHDALQRKIELRQAAMRVPQISKHFLSQHVHPTMFIDMEPRA
jgi:hypothetical protein